MPKQTKNTNKKTKKGVQKPRSLINSTSRRAPTSKGSQVITTIPMNRRSFTVTHTELVATLVPKQIGFGPILRLRINPASKGTFDWLPSIAVNYEFYKFKRIRFLYKTRSPTTSVGSLIISPDYDSEDFGAAISERNLFNNEGTSDASVWLDHSMELKPSSMNALFKKHVCMSDSRFETSNQDQKTIDCAQVHICTDVGPDLLNAQIGKLFVEYEVEFSTPQSPTESVVEDGFRVTGNTVGSVSNSPSNKNASGTLSSVMSPTFFQTLNEMQPGNDFANVQSTIGRFTKDYEGIVTVKGTSPGQTRPFKIGHDPMHGLFPTKEMVDRSYDYPTILQGIVTPTYLNFFKDATGAQALISRIMKVKAGDLLKIGVEAGPGDTFPGTFTVDFGGTGVFSNII